MNPETFNPINENMYRAGLMMIQYIMMMIGLASVLFILVALVAAACDYFAKTRQRARRQMDPATEPDTSELLAALAGLDDSFDESHAVSSGNRSTTRAIEF
jgi:hypothetical protein